MEIAQWLRVCIASLGDISSIPSTHAWQLPTAYSSSSRVLTPVAFVRNYTHMHIPSPIHIIKHNKSKSLKIQESWTQNKVGTNETGQSYRQRLLLQVYSN